MARSFSARAHLPLPAGEWQVSASAPGGLRVAVNGDTVLDAWRAQRGARQAVAHFTASGSLIEITVEYYTGRRRSPPVLQILPAESGHASQ